MLETYFKDPHTLTAFRSGPAGSHLDHFIMWLEIRGYLRASIRRHSREAHRFAAWAQAEGLTVGDLDQDTLHRFQNHLAKRKMLRKPNGDHSAAYHGSRIFVDFLEETGAVISCATNCLVESPALLLEFMDWMRTQRGARESTLTRYRRSITDLLRDLGTDASTFDAKGLRGFLLRHIADASVNKILPTAMRMFLRFLIARGFCMPGLDQAIPTVAKWRLSSLPKYLPSEDVERLINSCDFSTPLGARDRAILLLIARLGLRASDISALKSGDIVWSQATIIVSGKSRRATRLPLPQEVGDSILHYLAHGRPDDVGEHVFVTAIAPITAMTPSAVSGIVIRALRRTGINAPIHGAHLLRHSAATTMLRDGISLPAIGALLRHASIETTANYAKVDIDLLKEVALPWPEGQPC
jgi:site-specific recombinase XerD